MIEATTAAGPWSVSPTFWFGTATALVAALYAAGWPSSPWAPLLPRSRSVLRASSTGHRTTPMATTARRCAQEPPSTDLTRSH